MSANTLQSLNYKEKFQKEDQKPTKYHVSQKDVNSLIEFMNPSKSFTIPYALVLLFLLKKQPFFYFLIQRS